MWHILAWSATFVVSISSSRFACRMSSSASTSVGFLSQECMSVLESQLQLAQSTCNTKSIDLYVRSGPQKNDPLQLIVRSGDHAPDQVQG